MFKFCLIPFDERSNLVEMARSAAGGLEADELQVAAKDHFRDDRDADARYQSVKKAYEEQGQDFSTVSTQMLNSLAEMGASVEIISLSIASPENGFIGVSMYCDGNGESKGLGPNKRATDIARACGHANLVVRGDAFLARVYDNEAAGDAWMRRDLVLSECDVAAPWVVASRAANETRNMGAYTSSGAANKQLQNMLTQRGETAATGDGAGGTEGALTWTQKDDEVEVAIKVPDATTKKKIKVEFKVNSLCVHVEGMDPGNSELLNRLVWGHVALAGKIIPDDSTWCLGRIGDDRILQVTLGKADAMSWQTLFKPKAIKLKAGDVISA
jgi:hypothetical protein